jgi:hypothetical protein
MPNLIIYRWQGKKMVLERHSGLCSSQKELPERRSGMFRHKNTPAFMVSNVMNALAYLPITI